MLHILSKVSSKFKFLIYGGTSIVAMIFSSAGSAAEFKPYPYIGVDAGYSYMRFKKDYGDNLFGKNSRTNTFYVGYQFNQLLGFEIGLDNVKRKTRHTLLFPGDKTLSGVVINNDTEYVAWHRMSSLLFYLTGTHFITNKFSIGGGIGASLNKIYMNRFNLTGDSEVNFRAQKALLRLSANAKYWIDNNFGIKGIVGWSDTSRLKPNNTNIFAINIESRLKDSLHYGIGVIFRV